MIVFPRFWSTGAAALVAIALALPMLASTAHSEATPPTPDPAPTDSSGDKKGETTKPKATEARALDGYRAAYRAIYERADFAAGIAQLRALGKDNDADVANLIGFASRKLGRYDDAKFWYEKALAADPRHARTLSYYGMWHAEQGNLLKAAEFLDTVGAICGNTQCREYAELKGVIEGTRTY